jgi:hypothetical protein
MLDRIRNVARDPTVIPRYVAAKRKLLRLRYRERHNQGIFSVNIDCRNGFFGQLTWCLYIFAYCDDRNLIPHVVLTGAHFVNPRIGPDWFQYFFEQHESAYVRKHLVTTVGIRRVSDLGLPTRCFAQMSIERAARLAAKYLQLRPEISDAVEAFAAEHFAGRVVVGLHYRGTDKTRESPRVPYEEVRRVLHEYLERHSDVECLFVATDESPFLDYIRKACAAVPICCCDDLRSDSSLAIHRSAFAGDAYRKGREALVNALLLSRCHGVIRTASTLSAWASIFNPQLPVTMLNQPYDKALWFPDKAIVQRLRQHGAG